MVMSILMIGHKKHDAEHWRTQVQDGFWIVKIAALIAVLVISFFLPQPFLVAYGYVAMGGSAIFILMQIVLLVEFAYSWNESWVEKEWYKQVVASAIVIYLASLVTIILMYVWFGSTDCALNIFFITVTLLTSVVYTVLSLTDKVERGALLTSAVVTGVCTYYCLSAIMSGTTGECNKFSSGSSPRTWLLVIGVIIALLSVFRNTISAASYKGFFDLSAKPDQEEQYLLDDHAETCYNFSYFHFVFACGSMYFAMLLVDWNLTAMEVVKMQLDIGVASMWIKIVSQWVTILLYVWSLIGPLLCPHRQWD